MISKVLRKKIHFTCQTRGGKFRDWEHGKALPEDWLQWDSSAGNDGHPRVPEWGPTGKQPEPQMTSVFYTCHLIQSLQGSNNIPLMLWNDAVKVLHSIHQQIWKTLQWPEDWRRSVFISIPKKGNVKECSNYHTIALISHTSKVMLKILQARLQWYVNCELPDVQAGFRKGRETRDQIANIWWIIEKAREFQKNIYFCFIDYAKAFDCVDHNKLCKILKEMGIPDHLTCLLRNLYAGQEATVRTGHGTADWFQIEKGVCQGCILSPCLFNS